jgi:methionyl-tRNA formyltransferase
MSNTLKIVFLGTKPIGAVCLKYLLEQQNNLNYEIIAIGTKDRAEFSTTNEISQIANDNHIPLISHPDDIPECDILYSVQYHLILKQPHIAKARQIAVNLHLAPLPDYRGCNQFSFAIFHGAKEFGVTVHKIDEGIDSGDILFEDRFEMPKDIWVKELFNISIQKGIDLFKNTLAKIINKSYQPISQLELIASRGMNIHYRKDINQLKVLNLTESPTKTLARIRATYMPEFELPYFLIGDKKAYIQIENI